MLTPTQQTTLESYRTKLEKLMLELPTDKTPSEHKMYLAGVIDTYKDVNLIDDDVRGALYMEFVG